MSEMFPDEKRAANIVFKEKKLEKAEEDFENRFSGKEFVGGFEEKGKEGHKKYKESEISKAFSDDVRVGLEMGEVKYNEAGLKRMKKVEKEEGVTYEPFNMSFERDARIIDKEGNFIFENKRNENTDDAWLKTIEGDGQERDYAVILERRKARERKQVVFLSDKELENMLQEIIDNLHEAETCKQLIDRLYGRSKPLKNQPKSSTLKPGFKKNVRKNVADTIEKSSDLNSKDDPKKDTVMGERIVTACNVLLECDIYDVYNMTNDDIQSLLHRLSKLVEKINRGRELVDEEVTNIDDEEFDDEDETRKKRKKDGMIEFDDEDEDEDGEEERGDLGKRKIDSKIMERISKNNGFKMPPPMSKLKKPSGEIPTSRDKIGNGDSATLSKKIEKPEEVKVSPLDSAIDAMKVLNNQLDANPFSKTPTNLKENQTIEEDEQSDNDDIF